MKGALAMELSLYDNAFRKAKTAANSTFAIGGVSFSEYSLRL
jgi:hypothetical protein